MDAAEIAEKIYALEAGLAAKASRIADLEARVSLLEAENTRLRKAAPNAVKGQAMDRTGKRDLEEGFRGNKQSPADVVGGHAVNDVREVSAGEEEGMNVNVTNCRSVEDGLLAVPTTWECTLPVVGESGSEDETEDTWGGSGRDHQTVHCDENVGLDDDDVSVIPSGKKRVAAWIITSDSEDEDKSEKDGKVQEEVGVTPSRKRSLRGLGDSVSDNEDDDENVRVVSLKHELCVAETGTENDDEDEDMDDRIPICQVVQKMRGKTGSRDDGELGEINGCSTFTTRRSAQLGRTKAKRVRVARCGLDFVEPKEYMESDDDLEEADSMDGFTMTRIVQKILQKYLLNQKSLIARRNAKAKDWKYEAEMLSAFAEQPELCFKAVCALYRKQTEEEQSVKVSMVHNGQGFNQLDAVRGSRVAEFLLDGDAFGPPKKTVDDLEKYDPDALEFCENMAARYSKQLFTIYQNKEDPYFP